jgi:hypothetical protein
MGANESALHAAAAIGRASASTTRCAPAVGVEFRSSTCTPASAYRASVLDQRTMQGSEPVSTTPVGSKVHV